MGKRVTEEEIVRASFTSKNGTENWYLARALRGYGAHVEFVYLPDLTKPWPFLAIAGTRLLGAGNTGHFITVLDRLGSNYVIGDPLEGRIIQPQSRLRDTYEFTGFFMVVK